MMQQFDAKRPVSNRLIVIVGPTASGKSALAMRLAERLGGEIICADSRTVYKSLDIGTAKPTKEDQKRVPHHLLDIVGPDESFNVSHFKDLALKAINSILSRGKIPILVGGTGLYIDAVLFDYSFATAAEPNLRYALGLLSTDDLSMVCRLNHIALPINSSNKRHLIRVIETGGVQQASRKIRRNTIVVGITSEKAKLRQRIKKRAEEIFQNGAIEEGLRLGRQYGWDSEAMTGNIYTIIHALADDRITREEAFDRFVESDLSLAKRQMTWFKRNRSIHWGSDPDQLFDYVQARIK